MINREEEKLEMMAKKVSHDKCFKMLVLSFS